MESDREAKVLTALSHPNIAQIYGVEEQALVLELVEGETLQGQLSGETALDYAKQIADALRSRERKGHNPSRPEALQYQNHTGRQSEGARFWLGESHPIRPDRITRGTLLLRNQNNPDRYLTVGHRQLPIL
jgi:hypothetical protein